MNKNKIKNTFNNNNNKFGILATNSDEDNNEEDNVEDNVVNNEEDNNLNHNLDNEFEIFKNYYKNPKKEVYIKNTNFRKNNNYNYNNNNNNNNDNDFILNKRKEKNRVFQNLELKNFTNDFLEEKLSNYYRVLGHHNEDKSWDYISYYNITILNKWGDISSFINTLNTVKGECSYTDFDIFIMKNEISPMWEDLENRNGSICSIKIDSLKDGYEIFKKILVNICNNTLLIFSPDTWNTINGISFSPKLIDNTREENFCVIIKLWFKLNYIQFGNIDKYINPEINNLIKKYSIKIKPIKPEY
jgi:hypothetical protein